MVFKVNITAYKWVTNMHRNFMKLYKSIMFRNIMISKGFTLLCKSNNRNISDDGNIKNIIILLLLLNYFKIIVNNKH